MGVVEFIFQGIGIIILVCFFAMMAPLIIGLLILLFEMLTMFVSVAMTMAGAIIYFLAAWIVGGFMWLVGLFKKK